MVFANIAISVRENMLVNCVLQIPLAGTKPVKRDTQGLAECLKGSDTADSMIVHTLTKKTEMQQG